ncbi:3-methylcrotonoyl-CoA carboxylase [Thecamonas trahens ATCC 50062]|uniref:3-methylcrotonoyl-CoA carboxylase n=1 Tax=Thecamonas trahens ATCC 50062 TaxID=461836 RepID=A0A0L0DI70_THETB|nr:3-methylcrotonoyl-CoA carboxylase [Thecamonas trahens ATCC 50062]KNC51796.1 3-methylcrotonoyl-CoA carboxylase [Thecamonas trahens ATCC 50062]|eukprot:XP_013755665.1 3-methylcrotonoyl-CoA carboxylase [Thecamonas trahens ATCC 50062]
MGGGVDEADMAIWTFKKILVANRGEIAARVMRSAAAMNTATVAVHSTADANSLHVKIADEAVCIGPPPSAESYLQMDAILEAAKATGAQAIHPGYGFLSENAEFSRKCTAEGITFIGPPPEAMIAMASKSKSKEIMEAANVPVVPGYYGDDQSLERLTAEAKTIGYPIMIKAVMGGGGKGMRIVRSEAELERSLASVKSESLSSFGDDGVLIEKYLEVPRHIELQVFADTHGNVVHLFERDCSVQRRHQKVLEEAPAPGMDEGWRADMGAAAVAAAKAVNYVGAGTVEFIVDTTDNSYYFMEMNTRLQVEHPVTEMITGQDLVQLQLQVAAGATLPFEQDDLAINGHAIEARIYAEDPDNDFLPGTGTLEHLDPPPVSDSVRVDTGVVQGDEISVFYDPMIAKLIVWAPDRAAALAKLGHALDDYHIVGLKTNIPFVRSILDHPAFADATGLETGFIPKYGDDLLAPRPIAPTAHAMAALASALAADPGLAHGATSVLGASSPWATEAGFRPNHDRTASLALGDVDVHITTNTVGGVPRHFTITVGDEVFENVTGEYDVETGALVARMGNNTLKAKVVFEAAGTAVHLFSGPTRVAFDLPRPEFLDATLAGSAGSLNAPMPGKILQVLVKPGDAVVADQPLVVMEAMKMEHTICATRDGVVSAVSFSPNDIVDKDAILVELEAEDEE